MYYLYEEKKILCKIIFFDEFNKVKIRRFKGQVRVFFCRKLFRQKYPTSSRFMIYCKAVAILPKYFTSKVVLRYVPPETNLVMRHGPLRRMNLFEAVQ
jgi:hypothetical protein